MVFYNAELQVMLLGGEKQSNGNPSSDYIDKSQLLYPETGI
jgi:hypothetical protein